MHQTAGLFKRVNLNTVCALKLVVGRTKEYKENTSGG
jgi:hypothetical protein